MTAKKNLDYFREFLIKNSCTRALELLDQYSFQLQQIDNIHALIKGFMDNPEEAIEKLEKPAQSFYF